MTRDCCFCYCFLFSYDGEDVCNEAKEGEGCGYILPCLPFLLLSLKSLQDLSYKTGNCLTASASFSSRAAIFFLTLSLKGTGNEFFGLADNSASAADSVHLVLTGSEATEASDSAF